MKITKIKTFLLGAEQDNWVFVKVETDEGISGLGECSVEGREETVINAVQELAPSYIGQDPLDAGVLLYKNFRNHYWGGCAVLCGALSAVDIALWDIKGKALQKPIHKLLGGAYRTKLRAYANRWFFGADSPEKLATLARQTVEKGFTALKWDPFARAEHNIPKALLNTAVAEISAVRSAVGSEVDLLIEGHGRFNTHTALEIAREIAPFKPLFFEEPVFPENLAALAEVKEKSPVCIAAGERLYSRYDFGEAIRLRAMDFCQPDIRYCGGITELNIIAGMAQAAFLSMAPHNVHGLVGTAATLQASACMPHFSILEYSIEQTALKYGLFKTDIRFENGFVTLPEAPGLGIEINEEAVDKMPFVRHSMIEKMFD